MKRTLSLRRLWQAMAACASLCIAAAASAQVGPDPTSAGLEASAGPFTVSTSSVSSYVRGFGGGTIYYPSAAGQYGVVAISPGFTATQSSVAWLGRRLASHGLVVITINTNSVFDMPASRATQLMAALNHVVSGASSTIRSRVDSTRLAVSGHSMGGGGALIAAQNNPTLRASLPLTPWNNATNFDTVRVPTLIFGADGDTVASASSHARPFYASLPATTLKAYAELNNANHSTPNSTNTPIGRYSVAWMKRFVDADARYSPFLCGEPHRTYATPAVFDRYNQNCPY